MDGVVLHANTQRLIEDFVRQPSHAVLLHAPEGSGKLTLANLLAARILAVDLISLSSHPYVSFIDAPAISSEAIETVRKLEHFLSLKVPTKATVNRVVIISDAHTLSHEAQNALLKTVEEPPTGTVLILTAHSPDSLLSTIRSRTQSIAVKRPSEKQLADHFMSLDKSEADIKQALAISGGLPGLMSALLLDTDHPLRPATEIARQILQSSIYERMLLVDDLAKQKHQLRQVLFIMQQMAHARLQSTTGDQFKRWQNILDVCYTATEQLMKNGQPKLVLDTLMLKLN